MELLIERVTLITSQCIPVARGGAVCEGNAGDRARDGRVGRGLAVALRAYDGGRAASLAAGRGGRRRPE